MFEIYENLQTSVKSEVFDTSAHRERDFCVENSPNDTIICDFQSMGTDFMKLFRFYEFPDFYDLSYLI